MITPNLPVSLVQAPNRGCTVNTVPDASDLLVRAQYREKARNWTLELQQLPLDCKCRATQQTRSVDQLTFDQGRINQKWCEMKVKFWKGSSKKSKSYRFRSKCPAA